MLGRVFLVRHAEMQIPENAVKGDAATTVDSLNWGITPKGHAQGRAIGETLSSLNLPADTVYLTATGARFRETAYELTQGFGSNLRWFAEEYLNMRPHSLTPSSEISHHALYHKDKAIDESIRVFMPLGPERLMKRIREKLANADTLVVVTTGELIKGFLARIEGWPPLKIAANFLSKNESNHLKQGEVFEISSRDPATGESVDSFRFKRKISPQEENPVSDWEHFEVPRYTADQLIDPTIWGS